MLPSLRTLHPQKTQVCVGARNSSGGGGDADQENEFPSLPSVLTTLDRTTFTRPSEKPVSIFQWTTFPGADRDSLIGAVLCLHSTYWQLLKAYLEYDTFKRTRHEYELKMGSVHDGLDKPSFIQQILACEGIAANDIELLSKYVPLGQRLLQSILDTLNIEGFMGVENIYFHANNAQSQQWHRDAGATDKTARVIIYGTDNGAATHFASGGCNDGHEDGQPGFGQPDASTEVKVVPKVGRAVLFTGNMCHKRGDDNAYTRWNIVVDVQLIRPLSSW